MKRITAKRGVLAGALVLAAVVWLLDRSSDNNHPAAAQAGQSGALLADRRDGGLARADWEPATALVDRLMRDEYVPVAEEPKRTGRDLFVPTKTVEDAVAAANPVPGPGATEASREAPAVAEQDFRTRHKLMGVTVGGNPLAVVDGRVLPLNAELDGCTLIEVQRDSVVFQETRTGVRITLELAQRPKTP
jgi:hypothetical protein